MWRCVWRVWNLTGFVSLLVRRVWNQRITPETEITPCTEPSAHSPPSPNLPAFFVQCLLRKQWGATSFSVPAAPIVGPHLEYHVLLLVPGLNLYMLQDRAWISWISLSWLLRVFARRGIISASDGSLPLTNPGLSGLRRISLS